MYQRAPNSKSSIKTGRAYVDTRSWMRYAYEEIGYYSVAIGFILSLYFIMVALPVTWFLITPLLPIIWLISKYIRKYKVLPLNLPIWFKGKDYNSPAVARRFKYKKPEGIVNVGNDLFSREELWSAAENYLLHTLVLGATGAGKTELLISMSASVSFILCGGMIYIDAKAAPSLIMQFVTMARMFGREDNLRFMSYRTGNKEVRARSWEKLTNTCSVFAQGTSSVIQQILEDMMPPGGGDNAYFRDKAIATLKVLLPALVELRDITSLNLSPSVIAQAYSINTLVQMGWPEHHNDNIQFFNRLTGKDIDIQNIISEPKRRGIREYLKTMSGFKDEPSALATPNKQPEEVFKQFSYGHGYLVKPLGELASTQAHLFEVELGEIDFTDVISNNRLLVVMVPATEQSKDQKEMQGKLALSGVRIAMSVGLGSKSEGDIDQLLHNLPIDKRTPSLITVDEYPEIAIEGFAVSATQGRGLGCGMVFSAQDLGGMMRASKEETQMIFGSTRTKLLMSIEDVEESWEWFRKLGSTMKVAESSGWEKSEGISDYKKNFAATVKEVDRINFLDIKEQIEGEAHLFRAGHVIRTSMFHWGVDYEKTKNWRFNRMLQVRSPSSEDLNELKNELRYSQGLEYAIARDKLPESNRTITLLNSRIGEGTDWIYELLGSTASENVTHKETQAMLNSALKSPPALKKSAVAAEKETQSGPVQQKMFEEQQAESASPKTSTHNNTVDQWVYTYRNGDEALPSDSLVEKAIADLAKAMGMNKANAEKNAAHTVKEMKEKLRYTSKPIESDLEEDKELLLRAIQSFDDKK